MAEFRILQTASGCGPDTNPALWYRRTTILMPFHHIMHAISRALRSPRQAARRFLRAVSNQVQISLRLISYKAPAYHFLYVHSISQSVRVVHACL